MDLSNEEIRQRLLPVVRFKTLDRGYECSIIRVGADSVTVMSDQPLDPDEPVERESPFEWIREFDKKPSRSARRALARIVGLNVPNGALE